MIIVSMTTTSTRIGAIADRLEGILTGDRPPDRLVLNLGIAASHLSCKGIRAVPDDLQALADKYRQLEFRFTTNLGPATKFLPTLREQWSNPEQIIVTADDDVRYPPYWLQRLAEYATRYPDTLLCYTARGIKLDRGYEDWPLIRRNRVRKPTLRHWDYLPRGHDGVLYRPCFFDRKVFDIQRMLQQCPSNDDLWFTAKRLATVPVRVIPCQSQFTMERPGQPLYAINQTANDGMIKKITKELKHLVATEAKLFPTNDTENDEGMH